jgi:50S ribosomal protein L4
MSERTATVNVVSPAGSTGTTVDLPAEIFGAKVNVPLIHQVVVAQQAAGRQGTHATRGRGAVRGGGKKPYRQKGTGRARQGSIRAPQFSGGGVVHGPVPRSYEQRTPKKMKAAALRGALSDRAAHGRVHVVSGFTEGDAPRTRDALSVLLAAIGTTPSSAPVLVSDHVVFTDAALGQFLARSGFPGAAGSADARPEQSGAAPPVDSAEPPTHLPNPPHAQDAASPELAEAPEAEAPEAEAPEAEAPEPPTDLPNPPDAEDAES